jgi:hypothetical protein
MGEWKEEDVCIYLEEAACPSSDKVLLEKSVGVPVETRVAWDCWRVPGQQVRAWAGQGACERRDRDPDSVHQFPLPVKSINK